MLLRQDGSAVGLVSGGCLESDLAERARSVDRSRESRTVVYDLRSPDDVLWGLGLGCSGEVRVLLERLDPGQAVAQLEFLRVSLARRTNGAMAVVFEVSGSERAQVGDRWHFAADGTLVDGREDTETSSWVRAMADKVLAAGRSTVGTCSSRTGSVGLLVEHVEPPVALWVFGAGADAVPLVAMAVQLGWDVTVADPRPAYAREDRFPHVRRVVLLDPDRVEEALPSIDDRSACVVLTHNFVHDRRILEFLLGSRAPYIGLLGPRRRTENLLREIGGVAVEKGARREGRIHGPAGLDIGAETPAEIALSILAEIQARVAGHDAGFLRDREEPLHPRRPSA